MTDAEWIDDFARKLCVNLGLEPDELVSIDQLDCMTRLERSRISVYASGIALREPQWRLFRERAEMALAVYRTVNEMARIPE